MVRKGVHVMDFEGTVLTVDALLERAKAAPAPRPRADVGIRHEAASNARSFMSMPNTGDKARDGWRFAILQTLDDYRSTLKRGGPTLAAQVFTTEPPRTGSDEIDAAFAALAEFLAHRDGWSVPEWALDTSRCVENWYADVPAGFRDEAENESPPEFRSRGIYITCRPLARA